MINLFFFPHKITEEIYKKNNFFIDLYGFYKFKNGKKVYINIEFDSFKKNFFFKKNPPDTIIKKINEWGPVWSRFVDKGYNYELIKREILIKFYQIADFCIKKKIKRVIMSTYISHNLNSLLMDLVCEKLNIVQVFFLNSVELLYNNENRVIPIIQKNSFKNRNLIKNKISNYSFTKFINQKRKEIKNNKKQKFTYSSFWSSNSLNNFFIPSLILIYLYYTYSKIRGFFFKKKKEKFFNFMNYDVFSHVSILLQQNKAINYYKKKIKPFVKFKNKKYLLIAAHHQPEATSYPMGQEWNNHIDMCLELKRKKYKNKLIYKEHPLILNFFDHSTKHYRVGVSRSEEYYNALLNLGCNFLDHEVNSFSPEFLETFIPVTISGTIAIERSLIGYKTIYFGKPFWEGMPGTISINNIRDFENIDKYFGYDEKIEKQTVKFLISLFNKKSINNYVGLSNLHNNRGKFNEFKSTIKKIIY